MEICDEIHVGDIGTVFEVTLYEDCETLLPGVDTSTVRKLYFKKPDGSVIERDAVFTTDGADSKIQYVTVADDLDQDGNWELQGFIETPSGSWHSTTDCFEVFENLQPLP